jgi:hypothetical protein
MALIKFTASIVKKDKGCYLARADELLIAAEPATTQRGAIKKLKTAVLAQFRQAADAGRLEAFLKDAGYAGMLIHFHDMTTLQRRVFNSEPVYIRVPRRLALTSKRNRMKKEVDPEKQTR